MNRKIIIGFLLLFMSIVAYINFPHMKYHLSWNELNNIPTEKVSLSNIDEYKNYHNYIYAIEKDYGTVEAWNNLTTEKKENWKTKCNLQGFAVLAGFVAGGIIVLGIPVQTKPKEEKKVSEKQE